MTPDVVRRTQWEVGGVVAVIGLGMTLVIMLMRVVDEAPEPPPGLLEEAALAIVVLPPFVLGVLAQRFEPAIRGGVWAGLGVLILVLGWMTLISFIGLLFLPLGVLILIGAGQAARATEGRIGRSLTSAAVVMAAGVLAPFASFFLLPAAPECWERRERGDQAWHQVPVRVPGDWGYGGAGVTGMCSSDTVTPLEVSLAGGVWAVAAVGLIALNRREAR